jgi:hypothetical protein
VAVGFDREAFVAPQEVDLDRAAVGERHPGVHFGCREGRLAAEGEERLLELAFGKGRAVQVREH